MKRIFVVAESIDVEDSSGTKGRVAFINNLVKLGYPVRVIHYTRKNIHIDGVECINIKEIKFSLNYLLSRTQRVIQRTFKVNYAKKLEKIFGHSFTFFNDTKSISKAIKKYYDNEDLVITFSKGASYRPHYAMLSVPQLYSKWMAYVHDPYPFHYYPRPYDWLEPGGKFKENFFRKVSEKAQYSVFPSQMLLEWMGSYLPHFLKTGLVIPHQNSVDLIKSELTLQPREPKLILIHAGNLMNTRPVDGLLNGLSMFLEQNPEAKEEVQLHLIGKNGYFKPQIEEFQQKYPNVCLDKGVVDYRTANQLQSEATVSLIIESDVAISPFLPGKFPNCIAVNKPIMLLSPYYSETKRLLGEGYPYWAEVRNAEQIAKMIAQLYLKWKENPNLTLDRPDLVNYVSENYLAEQLKNIGF